MIVIRHALPDEYDEVGALLSASYAQYGPSPGDSPELVAKWAAYHEEVPDVRRRLDDAELIVADVDGRLLASVTYYGPRETEMPEGWPQGWAAFRLLGVHPEARGLGLGRVLTDWCIEQSRERGATALGLHTTPLMSVAQAMYERMGFERFPEKDWVVADDFVVVAYRMVL